MKRGHRLATKWPHLEERLGLGSVGWPLVSAKGCGYLDSEPAVKWFQAMQLVNPVVCGDRFQTYPSSI